MRTDCLRSDTRVDAPFVMRTRLLCVAICLVVVGGCATPAPRADVRQAAAQSVRAVSVERDLPLKLIAGELALQNDDIEGAARAYAEAAPLSSVPAIAEQATRLALAIKNWPLARAGVERWQQLDAKASGIIQARAWIALGEGNSKLAYTELEALLARSSDARWRPVAQVLLGAQDKAAAGDLLARLATPDRLGSKEMDWIAMSQLAFKLEDKALAEKLSQTAVERFRSSDAYAWSAQLALDSGDKKAARDRFNEALKRDPTNVRLRTGYAALLADSGDFAAAARALASGPQSDVTYAARAAYAARSDDKPLMEALYREIESDKSARSTKRVFLLGQLAEILGKSSVALTWYGEIPEGDERWLDAGVRSVVLIDQSGAPSKARERLAQLRMIAGAQPREAIELILLEAELCVKKNQKREAFEVYQQGLDQWPGVPRLLYARAMLAIELDDFATGERDLRQIIDGDPDNAEALNALGYTLADRNERVAEARLMIEKAMSLKPGEPAILDSYGWVKFRLGLYDEAITELRRAYALQPDAEIAAHLGEVLWVKGEHAEARRVWDEGRKKDAQNKVLLDTMKRLAS